MSARDERDHRTTMIDGASNLDEGIVCRTSLNADNDSLNASISVEHKPRNCNFGLSLMLLVKCIYISAFSTIGCLIRVALDHSVSSELANIENPSSVIFKSFFSNMLGSFMIGFLHALPLDRGTFLFVGLSTGLCGSVTTYSKWNQQVSMLLVGAVHGHSQSQIVAISAVIVGLLSFVCSYQMGKDTFKMISNGQGPKWEFNKNQANLWVCFLFASLNILLSTIAALYWNSNPFVASLCLGAIIAPLGALGRYALSKKTPAFALKGALQVFNCIPSGTLAANAIGSLALALTVVVEYWVKLSCSWQIVLTAIQSGTIASFTTVSTFVAEIVKLRQLDHRASGYVYAVTTLILCISLASLITGINHSLLFNAYNSLNLERNGTFYGWKEDFQPYCAL